MKVNEDIKPTGESRQIERQEPCDCVPIDATLCDLHAAAPALYEALIVAKQVIKELHERVFPGAWIIYETHSPEAQQINAALSLVAVQNNEGE